jgi:hypothetical protein
LVEECIAAALAHEGNFDRTTMDGLDPTTHSFPDGPILRRDELDTNQIGPMALAIADKTGFVDFLRFLLTVAKACAPVPASEASASAGGESALTDFERDLIAHLKGVNKGAQFLRTNETGIHIWATFFGPIMRLAGEFGGIDCGYFTIVAGIHFVNRTTAAGWHSCTDPLRKIRIDSLAATLAVEIVFMLGLRTKPTNPNGAGKGATKAPTTAKGAPSKTAAATGKATPAKAPRQDTLAAAPGIETQSPRGAGKAAPAKQAKPSSRGETHRIDAEIAADLGASKGTSNAAPTGRPTKPCLFFNKPGGCIKGDQCPFLHIRSDAVAAATNPKGSGKAPRQHTLAAAAGIETQTTEAAAAAAGGSA